MPGANGGRLNNNFKKIPGCEPGKVIMDMDDIRTPALERKLNSPPTIRAELIGPDICCALGLTARSPSPVVLMSRRLFEAGHDRWQPLHVYRDGTLSLIVRSIGEAAGLEVNGEGNGFRPCRKPDAAPPMRPNQNSDPRIGWPLDRGAS